jgi:shikimate dehydrogenase
MTDLNRMIGSSSPDAGSQGRIELGLIGFPVAHSRSPELHRAALLACGLLGEYRLYPVPPVPEGMSLLGEIIAKVRRGELTGLNVTIPHKENVIPLMDELSPTAAAVGAVNTIYRRENKVVGDNTDLQGFMIALRTAMARAGFEPPAEPAALVLGAGGSARAVVVALAQAGWQVTIAARRVEQAQILLRLVEGSQDLQEQRAIGLNTGSIQSRVQALPGLSLVVNATPLGMHPQTAGNPWPQGVPLPEKAFIFDLVYNPRDTTLVVQAQASGLAAASGLGMLVEQAALAFQSWTGLQAPRVEMYRAAGLE